LGQKRRAMAAGGPTADDDHIMHGSFFATLLGQRSLEKHGAASMEHGARHRSQKREFSNCELRITVGANKKAWS